MYVDSIGEPLKETIVASTSSNVSLILPIGKFEIFCEIWDKFGTYAEVVVGEAEVSITNKGTKSVHHMLYRRKIYIQVPFVLWMFVLHILNLYEVQNPPKNI